MEKAYDLKALAGKIKGRGLDVAEEGAKIIIEETFAWLEASAGMSSNPYDDMAKVLYPLIKDKALGLADKIDGQVG